MSARPCVGIFDANYASTLAVVRSLARMGAPFKVYHHHKRCVSALSRYVDTVRPSPFLDDYTRFPDWLNNQLDEGAFDLIMPTSDVVCFHIANTLDRIDPALAKHYPTRDAYLDVLFKDRFALRCNALGIPTPLTFEPKSLDDALAAADTLGYPVLLKPRSHVLMRHFRGQVVESPEQMRKHFAPYQPPPVEAAVLRFGQADHARDHPDREREGQPADQGRLSAGAEGKPGLWSTFPLSLHRSHNSFPSNNSSYICSTCFYIFLN